LLDALAGGSLSAHWDDATGALKGTGRLPASAADAAVLGPLRGSAADRLTRGGVRAGLAVTCQLLRDLGQPIYRLCDRHTTNTSISRWLTARQPAPVSEILGSSRYILLESSLVSATISVRNLRKSYGSKFAVDDVSFEVEQGEFVGILGPNGAGKTTTLEILEGLRKPDSGELSVLGLPPWPRNTALLPRIGVQLQASSFFERLTAREQIRTFASLYHVPAKRADHMLSVVGLDEQASVKAEKLSGGQAQRLSIACALVHDPELVFMDEPTGALDPQARRNLWDLLRKINADGRTVVLTTHHMDEAETLCDRVAIMDYGKILQLGPPAALVRGLDTPTRISIQSGLLDPVAAGRLAAAADSPPADSVSGTGDSDVGVSDDGVSLTFATREPAVILAELAGRNAVAGLRVQGATLEDVFLQLTGREYRA